MTGGTHNSLRECGRWQARWYNDGGDRQSHALSNRTEPKKFLDRVSADRHRDDYLDHRQAARRFPEVADEQLAVQVRRPKTLAGYWSLAISTGQRTTPPPTEGCALPVLPARTMER